MDFPYTGANLARRKRPLYDLTGGGLDAQPHQRPAGQEIAAPQPIPTKPAAPQPPAASGGYNAFSAIGMLLGNVAAGMQGQPLPSDQIAEMALKRQEMQHRKSLQDLQVVSTIAEKAGAMPYANRAALKSVAGKFNLDPGMASVLEAVLESEDPQVAAQGYGPIYRDRLAVIGRSLGSDAMIAAANNPSWLKQTEAEVAKDSYPLANAKMKQIITLVGKAGQAGKIMPETATALRGQMTLGNLATLNEQLPENMKLNAGEMLSMQTYGFNDGGLTILSQELQEEQDKMAVQQPFKMEQAEAGRSGFGAPIATGDGTFVVPNKFSATATPLTMQGGGNVTVKPKASLTDLKAIDRASVAAGAGSEIRNLLESQREIMSKYQTSATAPIIGTVGRFQSAVGLAGEDTKSRAADFEKMQALAKDLGIRKLSLIGGSDTERELAIAIETAPSPEKTIEANTSIIDRQLKAVEILEAYPDFMAEWLDRHGSLTAKDPETGEYMRAAWRRLQKESFAGSAASQSAADPGFDARYEQMPSGTEFIAPDGSRRRKP